MGSRADSPCQGEMARRARGGRVGEYEREALILSRALAPLWFLSGRPERNPPRRAELPCRPQAAKSPMRKALPDTARPTQKGILLLPLIRHGFAVPPSPQGEGFWGGTPSSGPFGATFAPGGRLRRAAHGAAPAAETDLLERNREIASPLFSRFSFSSFCARLNLRFCFSLTRKAGPSHA